MEKILPAFKERNVSICFSVNDKYAPLLATAIESIIKTSTIEHNYDIVILMTDLDVEIKISLLSMIRTHQNFSIRFVNVGAFVFGYKFYTDSSLTNTKYSDEIYYRVLIPSIMEAFEKTIFLDADVILLDDIANLYAVNLENNYVGAVRDFEGIANCYTNGYERTKYRINDIGMKNFEDYFTSGVMIFNIKEFSSKFDQKSLLDLAVAKDWRQYDQDLFNYICKGNVKLIDAGWNFVEDIDGTYQNLPARLFNEYLESEKHPKLIHFSGNRKPWIRANSKFNKYFWDCAKNTKFAQQLEQLKEQYE